MKNTLPNKALIQTWWRNQKLYRQTKAKRIQNHQTSSSTNAKGSSLDRKHRKGLEKQTQNNKVNGNGIIFINNNLKCKWVQCSNQKTKAGWMDTKTKPLYILSTRDSPQTKGHIGTMCVLGTESEGLEKDISCKWGPKYNRSCSTYII